MQPILGKWAEPLYDLMRIVVGLMFAVDGVTRLRAVFGAANIEFSRFLAAGIVETVCGSLVLLGLFTSLAALVAAAEMAVTYLWIHLSGSTPILGGGKLPLLYCVAFLFIAARGSGRFSLDKTLWPTTKPA
jgi:putative oxidoreductase